MSNQKAEGKIMLWQLQNSKLVVQVTAAETIDFNGQATTLTVAEVTNCFPQLSEPPANNEHFIVGHENR